MDKKSIQRKTLVLCSLAAVWSMGPGLVRAEGSPLYLTLSQTLTRDNNLLRDNVNRRRDTVSTTSLGVGLNKPYGRQNYKVSAAASRNAYRENRQYDNDGYAVSADVDTEIGSNVRLALSGAASQFLPNFENQTDRTVRNIQRNQQVSADLRYGLHGRWSVNAGASRSKVDFKVAQQDDKTSTSTYVGARYLPSDLAYIGLNLSRTDTDLPYRVLSGLAWVGETIERTSLGLDTVWQVTGFSRLAARVAATSEKHPDDRRRDFDGLTGSASWQFTPRGKVSYALSWVRDTSNEGGQTLGQNINADSVYSTNHRLSNTFTGSATWQATAKVALNAAYTHARYQEDYGLASQTVLASSSRDGRYNAFSLGVSYQAIRAVGLGCDIQRYDRTASTFSRAYDGNSVACRASFTLD